MNDERITRIRQLVELIYADARTLVELEEAEGAIDVELMHAFDHRERIIRRSEQKTQLLSTDDASSGAWREDKVRARLDELAARSGALEPEETTDGPNRRGV